MLGTSLLWRSTVAFTFLQVKSAKYVFVYFRWSWSCYFGIGLVSSGLGLVLLFLILRIWSCLHHLLVSRFSPWHCNIQCRPFCLSVLTAIIQVNLA